VFPAAGFSSLLHSQEGIDDLVCVTDLKFNGLINITSVPLKGNHEGECKCENQEDDHESAEHQQSEGPSTGAIAECCDCWVVISDEVLHSIIKCEVVVIPCAESEVSCDFSLHSSWLDLSPHLVHTPQDSAGPWVNVSVVQSALSEVEVSIAMEWVDGVHECDQNKYCCEDSQGEVQSSTSDDGDDASGLDDNTVFPEGREEEREGEECCEDAEDNEGPLLCCEEPSGDLIGEHEHEGKSQQHRSQQEGGEDEDEEGLQH
jgi:hypothetical protein